MISYIDILAVNYSNKQWIMVGTEYSGLDWLDSSPKPTKEELDTLFEPTQATLNAKQQAETEAKASALSKLTALGLTQDEVKALLGVA